MPLAQDHQRLAALFLEGHRGDRPARATFVIGPREARIRLHFDIRAEKRGGLGTRVEHQSVLPSDTSIHLAGQQLHSQRLRHPPTLEQLGLGKCLEHDARGTVDGPRDSHLAVRRPFHRGAVLHGAGLTFDFCVHCASPRLSSSTTFSNSSKRSSQRRRYRSSHAVSSSSRRGPSWQVRTRPIFFVVTSPACSRTPTCFFMPVSVMWNLSARSVIDASARPSCSSTPRRVASESAANEASSRVGIY